MSGEGGVPARPCREGPSSAVEGRFGLRGALQRAAGGESRRHRRHRRARYVAEPRGRQAEGDMAAPARLHFRILSERLGDDGFDLAPVRCPFPQRLTGASGREGEGSEGVREFRAREIVKDKPSKGRHELSMDT